VTGSRRRWVLPAIPQVLLFGGMTVMLIVHPNAFTSALHSTRAIAVNAALLAGWLLLSLVIVPRVVRNAAWDAALLSVVAIAAIVVLIVPTLRDQEVIEEFPAAAAEPTTPPTTVPGVTTPPGATTPPTTAAPPPVKVSTGALAGIGHDASGTVSIYRRPDGTSVVALEGIDIEPGPDYRVIVVRGSDVQSPGDGLELDTLRGNQGTQYYEVPSGTAPGDGWTVLIWCRAFGVPVANASQRAT
jgi:Electron transfer DM13